MKKYDVIIGLEIHTELKTKSKMFCSCVNEPLSPTVNKNTCPICLGHPGTLPAVNKQAVEHAILLSLALQSHINRFSKFDRKNYFYPDLTKGYQISQYDLPVGVGGYLPISPNRSIDITRLHLEEDTGKLAHGETISLVDYNRAGVPLIELVTEPVIRSSQEAGAFCRRFRQTLRYLNISDADMEKGLMRCEANVSVQIAGSWEYSDGQIKPLDQAVLNSKVEVKNINSFKSLEKAIEYEIQRQTTLLENGETVLPETRGWDDSKNETKSQRIKESSADYRYFPEPDLAPLVISDELIEEVRSKIVELPHEKIARFINEYGLPEADADNLAGDIPLANFFEQIVSELRAWIETEGDDWERQNRKLSKSACNWLMTELVKHLNASGQSLENAKEKINAEHFAELVKLVYLNKINSSAGQTILQIMFEKGGNPTHIMQELGLEQTNDKDALIEVIKNVLENNPSQASEYKAGKDALIKFFIGKTMAATGGKANPQIVEDILNELKNQ